MRSHYLFIFIALLLFPSLIFSCAGDDRSSEEPLLPAGVTVKAIPWGDNCILQGTVEASHNSHLLKCGFHWGNDTLRKEAVADIAGFSFADTVALVGSGRYYAVAYATNGIGTTLSDTLYFFATD